MRRIWLALVFAIVLQSSSTAPRAAAVPSLFSSRDIVELELEAPFTDLLSKAQQDDDYSVIGRLSHQPPGSPQKVEFGAVEVSTRGHTSKQANECEFPKLKLKFRDAAPEGSLFAGTETLKLGTHCGDKPDGALSAKFGRLANEKAPHREALVYRVLAAVGVPTLLARPARITYTFADAGAAGPTRLVRNAMLLEDDQEAMKRFGASLQLTEDRFESARSTFAPADSVRLAFAEAMVGNFDWCLRFFPGDRFRCNDRHPLWNILGLVRPDGSTVPAIYDFDLSGMVVARHIWFRQVFDESFLPSRSRVEIEALSQLQRTRSLFGREELDGARAAFSKSKSAAYQAIAESPVDDQGRQHAETYLNAFFAYIETDEEFYRPVVVDPQARAYLDNGRTQPACGAANRIPVGTPVSAPVEAIGTMVRVRLLDAQWKWTPPRRCDVIHRQPVWIERAAVSTNYPR
jgi:hypothetical protein